MRREVKRDGSTVLDGLTLSDILLAVYPVGSYYVSETATSPATLFGGTWLRVKGRVVVGLDELDTSFDVAGETGGHKSMQAHNHTGAVTGVGDHVHGVINSGTGGQAVVGSSSRRFTNGTGDFAPNASVFGASIQGGGGHNHGVYTDGSGDSGNLQPFVVAYMWKRTA
jgi:hypothetical protein